MKYKLLLGDLFGKQNSFAVFCTRFISCTSGCKCGVVRLGGEITGRTVHSLKDARRTHDMREAIKSSGLSFFALHRTEVKLELLYNSDLWDFLPEVKTKIARKTLQMQSG